LAPSFGAEQSIPQLEELADQNRRLQEQIRDQQKTIEAITARLMHVLRVSERHERELLSLHQRMDAASANVSPPPAVTGAPLCENSIRVFNATAFPFSNLARNGQFPAYEFRIDHSAISPEALVWKNVYFCAALRLPRQTFAWNPTK
jgi:hypothetical protein